MRLNEKLTNWVVSLLAVVTLAFAFGCDGGGGGGESSVPTVESVPNATGTSLDDDELIVVCGSAEFAPSLESIMLTSAENKTIEGLTTTGIIDGVSWASQVPPFDLTTSANCGPTSYLMAESFYYQKSLSEINSESKIKDIIDWMAANVSDYTPNGYNGASTSPVQLANLAKSKGGFDARVFVGSPTDEKMDVLRNELKNGYPVIVRVLYQFNDNNTEVMERSKRNTNRWNSEKQEYEDWGHFMLLVGMDDNYVYLNDPGKELGWKNAQYNSNGNLIQNYGYYRKYTKDSFDDVWTHVSPNGAGGRSGVFVHPLWCPFPPGIDIKSLSFSNGLLGQQYCATLTAVGGLPLYIDGLPLYNWSMYSGSLPDGLSLTNNGTIIGIPNKAGTFYFTLRVEDALGQIADGATSMTISADAPNSPSISTARVLISGRINIVYNMSFSASGGTGPYTWTLISGGLPPGLSLTSDGKIIGIPTVEGTNIFSIQLTDKSSTPQTVSKSFEITILKSVTTNPLFQTVDQHNNPVSGAYFILHNSDGSVNKYAQTNYLGIANLGSIAGDHVTMTIANQDSVDRYTIWSFVNIPILTDKMNIWRVNNGNPDKLGTISVEIPGYTSNVWLDPFEQEWSSISKSVDVNVGDLQTDGKVSIGASYPFWGSPEKYGFLTDQTYQNGGTYTVNLNKDFSQISFTSNIPIGYVDVRAFRKGLNFYLGYESFGSLVSSGSFAIADQVPADKYILSADNDTFDSRSMKFWEKKFTTLPNPLSINMPNLSIDSSTVDGNGTASWTASGSAEKDITCVREEWLNSNSDQVRWYVYMDPSNSEWTNNLGLPDDVDLWFQDKELYSFEVQIEGIDFCSGFEALVRKLEENPNDSSYNERYSASRILWERGVWESVGVQSLSKQAPVKNGQSLKGLVPIEKRRNFLF